MIGLGEQRERGLQSRRRHVEHRLDPGQADVDAETGPFGLQQLGELLAGMRRVPSSSGRVP